MIQGCVDSDWASHDYALHRFGYDLAGWKKKTGMNQLPGRCSSHRLRSRVVAKNHLHLRPWVAAESNRTG